MGLLGVRVWGTRAIRLPNGLVWVGKNQGIADGCDYPWRHSNICNQKDLANPPQSTEQFCIGGLLYNEETHACDWPQNVAGCQKHPLCKDDANGNVPLGKSCNRYWACQGGYPRLKQEQEEVRDPTNGRL